MKRAAVIKWTLYILFALVVMLLQEHLFSRLRIFGVHPMMGGILTAVVSMFEGGIGGAAFGLFTGILQDSSVAGEEGFFALVYMAGGLTTGMVCEYMFRKSFFTALLWSLIITSVTTLSFFTVFFLLTGRAGIQALWNIALPEILYSVLMLPLVYFPARRIAGDIERQ